MTLRDSVATGFCGHGTGARSPRFAWGQRFEALTEIFMRRLETSQDLEHMAARPGLRLGKDVKMEGKTMGKPWENDDFTCKNGRFRRNPHELSSINPW